MSRASARRPRTAKTYQYKLNRLKVWYADREKWRKIRLEKAQKEGKELTLKPLNSLDWYVDQLRKSNQVETKTSTPAVNRKPKGGWWA